MRVKESLEKPVSPVRNKDQPKQFVLNLLSHVQHLSKTTDSEAA